MGSLISGEQWLLELHDSSTVAAPVATSLLRCQILTSARRGHVLVFGYEYTRRLISRQAQRGCIAHVWIACQRCFCQARLSDWVRVSWWEEAACQSAATGLRAKGLTAEVLYLQPCPGDEYARDILKATQCEVR